MSNEIDETKLTACALDELDESERGAIESRLEHDETARAELDQIRRVAGLLKEQLAAEPLPERAKLSPRARRSRWREYALAASIVVVISGVAVAILLPVMSKARYSSKAAATRAAAEQF